MGYVLIGGELGMSSDTESPVLYSAKPSLVREWHPTKNGNLTPRNVASNFDKNVWWLCEQGHEWQAPVKDRVAGEKCPICVKDIVMKKNETLRNTLYQRRITGTEDAFSQATYHDFEMDSPEIHIDIDYRKSTRYKYQATAILENPISGISTYAQMQNISKGEIYLVTNSALKKGEYIRIKFNEPPPFTKARMFRSTVSWCKAITDDEGYAYAYGLGMKFT